MVTDRDFLTLGQLCNPGEEPAWAWLEGLVHFAASAGPGAGSPGRRLVHLDGKQRQGGVSDIQQIACVNVCSRTSFDKCVCHKTVTRIKRLYVSVTRKGPSFLALPIVRLRATTDLLSVTLGQHFPEFFFFLSVGPWGSTLLRRAPFPQQDFEFTMLPCVRSSAFLPLSCTHVCVSITCCWKFLVFGVFGYHTSCSCDPCTGLLGLFSLG